MRHSNKERDNVAESRPGSNTGPTSLVVVGDVKQVHQWMCKAH